MNNPRWLPPTEREYMLTVKPVVKCLSFEDYQSTGKFVRENDFVFLEPVENDQWYAFFAAWMPVLDGAHHEVVLEFQHPLAETICRAAVFRSSVRFKTPHLQLMTYGVNQLIIAHPSLQNREINVRILSENDEAVADLAHDGELPFKKKNLSGFA